MRFSLFFVVAALSTACGAQVDDTANTSAGANKMCCPISDKPSCCMAFGGSNESCRGKLIGEWLTCDNLPDPSDARWEKRTDENGCAFWYAPPAIPLACKVGGTPTGETCHWTDDAGAHEESCSGGCCLASATGSRCVPKSMCGF